MLSKCACIAIEIDHMLPMLINGIVGPVPVYKKDWQRSMMDQQWSQISTKINSNSTAITINNNNTNK